MTQKTKNLSTDLQQHLYPIDTYKDNYKKKSLFSHFPVNPKKGGVLRLLERVGKGGGKKARGKELTFWIFKCGQLPLKTTSRGP